MEEIRCKVLIVGSGGAGLRCAIQLKEKGFNDFLVVGNRKISDPHTKLAAGGINAALATLDIEDTPDIHAADTIAEGQLICNPTMVQILTKEAPHAIEDLLRYGAQFHTENDGRLTQRLFGAHTFRRTVFSGDKTGQEIMRVLVNQVNELSISYLEDTHIFKIITNEERVIGALGVNKSGYLKIECEKVVLATGGYSGIYSRSTSRKCEGYGLGVAMALEAGAKLADMELIQFHPTGLVDDGRYAETLVSEALRGEGGYLLNNLKQRFMQRYDPERLELSTRDTVARAIYTEIKEGNGTTNGGVLLDVRNISREQILDRFPKVYQLVKKAQGKDISRELFEVAPTAHYTMGGIVIDPESGETSVKGLYAIGECTAGMHGANRLGGNSLAEILVYGKRVANAILASRSRARHSAHKIKLTRELELLSSKMSRDGELRGPATLQEIKDLMWKKAGIVRSPYDLEKARNRLEELIEQIDCEGVINGSNEFKNIVRENRLKAVAQIAFATVEGALLRKESRGAHYRTDYPNLDPKLQGSFIFSKNGDKLKSEFIKSPKIPENLMKIIDERGNKRKYGHVE